MPWHSDRIENRIFRISTTGARRNILEQYRTRASLSIEDIEETEEHSRTKRTMEQREQWSKACRPKAGAAFGIKHARAKRRAFHPVNRINRKDSAKGYISPQHTALPLISYETIFKTHIMKTDLTHLPEKKTRGASSRSWHSPCRVSGRHRQWYTAMETPGPHSAHCFIRLL